MIVVALDLTHGTEALAESLRSVTRRMLQTEPGAAGLPDSANQPHRHGRKPDTARRKYSRQTTGGVKTLGAALN
jgi:hypothetical protein